MTESHEFPQNKYSANQGVCLRLLLFCGCFLKKKKSQKTLQKMMREKKCWPARTGPAFFNQGGSRN